MNGDRALVMLSGGLDSATCLYWARRRYGQHNVSAITFNYYGRLANERRSAGQLAKSAGIDGRVIEVDIPFVKEASDFDFNRFGNGPDTRWASYVPARNMIFYSIAAHYAEYLGIRWIIGGHNGQDVAFFKDASRGYIEKMNALFREACLLCSNGMACEILLPLADMDRMGVIRLAMELGVPLELTWSCHRESDSHCSQCYACRQRLEAFGALGISDPAFR